MKHAKLELLARIKAHLEETSQHRVFISYGHGGFFVRSVKVLGAMNVEFGIHGGNTLIMSGEDILYAEFYCPEATGGPPSGGAQGSQEETKGEFDMKVQIPSTRNPMAGALQHASNRQQVVPNRKRVKAPLSKDFEYDY